MPAGFEAFTNNVIRWLQAVGSNIVWIGLAALGLFLLGHAVFFVLKLLTIKGLIGQESVFLEITPPASVDNKEGAAEQLFRVLHDLEKRLFRERMLRKRTTFSLEEASTEDGGIRYIMRVPADQAPVFEHHLASCLSAGQVKRVDDYLPKELNGRNVRVMEFRQGGRSFAYPLRKQAERKNQDAGDYLNGALTKLKEGELIAFQLVVTPVTLREVGILDDRLANNEELILKLGRGNGSALRIAGNIISTLLFGIMNIISDIVAGGSSSTYSSESSRQRDAHLKLKPMRALTPILQELTDSVHDKLAEVQFYVSIRALVVADSPARSKHRETSIKGALNVFKTNWQSLKARSMFLYGFRSKYRLFAFRNRLPAIRDRRACILGTTELADLYQFPRAGASGTENMAKSLSKILSAPTSLKGKTEFDVVLGRNYHHGSSTDIGLILAERERHVYIIGATGTGKTTMLEYAMLQDMKNGKGLAVVDPHGDLSKFVLRHVPKDRVDDVVYFNPFDYDYPPGLNLMELKPDLSGNRLAYEKDIVAEAVIEIFRKIFSEDGTGGHRIEYVLRNAVHTALTVEGATLFTVYDLLTDPKYRKQVVRNLDNPRLKNFWNNEYGRAGSYQQVSFSKGVTTKIGRFEFSPTAKRIVEQPKSTINFEDIMDSGKILVCNLAKGAIGSDTSELFGITVLAKLQMAANRRIMMEEEDRRPFHLYVDEFQHFATTSFTEILSQARKFKLYITMAEQSTSQQDKQVVNNILNNAGTIICFRTGSPADEQYMLPFFAPYIGKGEIGHLPVHHFYASLGAIYSQEPTSGKTLVVEEKGSKEIAEAVVKASQKNYAIKYKEPPKSTAQKAKPDPGKKKGGGAPKRKSPKK